MLPFSCSRGKYLAKHCQDIKKNSIEKERNEKTC